MYKVKKKVQNLILPLVCILNMALQAQVKKPDGIAFDEKLSWQEINALAKKENKYIFVDCYASWCGPCKMMDMDVYSRVSVGEFMNDTFISVKIQMDTTSNDNDQIKNWYQTAKTFAKSYRVRAYPTLLFFSPDGKPVYEHIGGMSAWEFLDMAKDALDSNKQNFQNKE